MVVMVMVAMVMVVIVMVEMIIVVIVMVEKVMVVMLMTVMVTVVKETIQKTRLIECIQYETFASFCNWRLHIVICTQHIITLF